MKTTYASQRQMILNADPIDTILLEWPFLGKVIFVYSMDFIFIKS
jgi:hypothetical protein